MRGFTLIELIVATAIFVVVIGIIGGIYIQINKAQRISVEIQNSLGSMRYPLEVIAKAIRMSNVSSTDSGNEIWMDHPTKGNLKYDAESVFFRPNLFFASSFFSKLFNEIKKIFFNSALADIYGPSIREHSGGDFEFLAYFFPHKKGNLYFEIRNVGDDDIQPRIIISFYVYSKVEGKEHDIKVQTTVVPRRIED